MPIRPENKARYPKDWKGIASKKKELAGNCCEGSPDFPDCRAANGKPHPVTGSLVVLTVAHLDHQPENCDPENLRAWCQRCHLNYDKQHHAQTAYATRKQNANTQDMFGEDSCTLLFCTCGWKGKALHKTGCLSTGDTWYVCPLCGVDGSFMTKKSLSD